MDPKLQGFAPLESKIGLISHITGLGGSKGRLGFAVVLSSCPVDHLDLPTAPIAHIWSHLRAPPTAIFNSMMPTLYSWNACLDCTRWPLSWRYFSEVIKVFAVSPAPQKTDNNPRSQEKNQPWFLSSSTCMLCARMHMWTPTKFRKTVNLYFYEPVK